MAYNFGYQQYYPQNQNYNQTNNSIIWVQGEAGAKSYLVAPNSTVQLWDSEEQVIYLKSADSSGMPSMKVIDYTIRNAPQPAPAVVSNDFVTHDELVALEDRIKKQIEKLKEVGNESAV